MRLRITAHLEREHLVWAVWYQLFNETAPTKRGTLVFLREQVEMFGTDPSSLMGSSAEGDMDESPKEVLRAEQLVDKWWPGMRDEG